MPTNICKTCKEEYEVRPSREDESKFCSRECYHSGQKRGKTSHSDRRVDYIEFDCTGCGKKIEKPPSRANRSERQFCSQECYLSWNSKHQRKSSGKRQRKREKEKASCEICGYDRFIEMAHIIPSKDGGTYHKNNILFLCPNHHRLLDHRKINTSELKSVENKLRRAICDGDGFKSPENTDEHFSSQPTNFL